MHPGYQDTASENFLARVQQHTGLVTRTETDRLTRATLTALAEGVSAGQLRDLFAGLPEDFRISADSGRDQARSFDKDAFIDSITCAVATVDAELAERRARGVLHTVGEWAPEGEIEDTLAQLPPELSQLFY